MNGFALLHPIPCLLYYIGAVVLGMMLFHPLFLLTAVLLLIILNGFHDGGRRLRANWRPFLLMTGFVAIMNPLFSHRGSHILFYLFDRPVTLESVAYGLMMMLSLQVIVLVCMSYNAVITPDKFFYLFGRMAPQTVLLCMMTFRFVPLLKQRYEEIALVQRTRGIHVGQGSLRSRMRSGMRLLYILLTWSLEEGLHTADSMKGRGYGTGARSSYTPYRMDRTDRIMIGLLLLTGIGCLLGRSYGYGVFPVYPRLGTWDFSVGHALVYGLFFLFLSLPIVIEGKEWWQWRSWK
ncbi:energy-coupling factor transporter transmembrane protein EcfT [Aneurinibacillus sp. BA2021]|nr:energy-coupling factor transporter transmembrane protein EcfT [Aneurinibacillus sp. BA2021]